MKTVHTVDGSEILHQLRLEVYPIIFEGFYICTGWLKGFCPSTVPVIFRHTSPSNSRGSVEMSPFKTRTFPLGCDSRLHWLTVRKRRGFAIWNDSKLLICIPWVAPLPSNGHHQDFYIFSTGSQTKSSFVTTAGKGDNPTYQVFHILFFCMSDPGVASLLLLPSARKSRCYASMVS